MAKEDYHNKKMTHNKALTLSSPFLFVYFIYLDDKIYSIVYFFTKRNVLFLKTLWLLDDFQSPSIFSFLFSPFGNNKMGCLGIPQLVLNENSGTVVTVK